MGLYTRSQGWGEQKKQSFQSASQVTNKQMLNFMALYLAQRLEKKIPTNLGSQFANHWARHMLPSFTNILTTSKQNAQNWPQVFFQP